MATTALSKRRFQSWQLTGKGRVAGVFPLAEGLQPDLYTELELDKELVVGIKEYVEGSSRPLERRLTYDSQRRLQYSDYTDPSTGLSGRNSYEYDARGCLSARQETDPQGRIRFRTLVRCDSQGRFLEEEVYDRRQRLQERHTYEHDSRGNVVKDVKFVGAEGKQLEGYFLISYDDRDRIVRRAWHGADGKERNTFLYQYDANDLRTEIAIESGGVRTLASRMEYDERGRRRSTEFLDQRGTAIARETMSESGRSRLWEAAPPQATPLQGKPLAELAHLTPEQLNALAVLAYSYFEQGYFKEALSLYESLALLEPGNPAHAAGAGTCALALEQPQVALTWYDRALARSATHVPSLVGKAEVQLKLGHVDEALELYKLAFTHAQPADAPVMRRARLIVATISQAAPQGAPAR